MIISLYAGGMTVRDIRHHLASTLGVEVSATTISTITDAVCEAVLEWQHAPYEAFYPVIYLDAIRIKVRRRSQGGEPGRSPGGRSGHGGRQARAGHLGPSR